MDAGADNSGTRRKRHNDSTESRKRVARACNECRRLKEKCPGGDPCSRCTRFRRPCGYEDARPRTQTPHDRDRQGFFDADRIRLLEQIVEHSTGTVCFEKARLADVLDSLRPPSHDNGPCATSEDEDFTINPVSPTAALYSGELSHSNFSLRLQQRVERRLNQAVPELQSRSDAPADSPSAIKLRSQASVVIDAVDSFPPAEVAAFLADVFFKFAQTNYSYVDEQTLRQKLGRFYSLSPELDINDAPWVCTILMIFAIGTQFAHLSSSAEDGTDQQSWHGADDILALDFYRKASGLISDVIAVASIESVQAFLLLGVYTLPIDAAGLSCTYLGIAIKIATQNGMHRKHHKTLASRQVELRRRIWWTAYTLERRICVLHGRPVSISRAEIDVDLPQDLPELRVAPQTHALPNMLAMIRLTEALENAKEAIFTFKRASRKRSPTLIQPVLQLKQELQQYWQSLPENTFCRDLTPGKPLFRFNIHLALMYHLIFIFLGRSFILKGSTSETVENIQMPEWTKMRDELVDGCICGALAVIDLCQTLDSEMGLARSSYTEFTSCCAALLAVLARRISAQNTRLQTACDTGIKLLKKMSVGVFSNSSEKLTVEALETAIHRLDSCSVASPATSGVAYAQFRQWAMSRQTLPQQCNELAAPRQTTTNTASTPQNADAMQGLYSFGLDDLSSLPGLDQWFEFGLH